MATKKMQIIGNFMEVDSTLTQAGRAADAKAAGDAINQMQASIDEVVDLVGGSSVADQIAGKADVGHSHDDRYYTEVEIDNKISELNAAIDEKSDIEHMHAIADITDLQAELDYKYEKPSDGIPATDLAAGVQESLNKADTAIQSLDGYATEGYVAETIAAIAEFDPSELQTAIDSKADSDHDHNDLYYTETEINAKLGTMQSDINSKVTAVDGMGLSTNDYTITEKDKLAGIEDGANAYVHPDYTPKGSGLYKLSIDEFGHVYEAAAVVKDDIVALGIPSEDTNTTYDDELSALTTRIDELQEDVSDAQNSADQVAANLSGYMESNDTAVGNNTGNIAKNAGEIEAIKADYLTSADKEESNGRIDELVEDIADNATAIGVLNGDSEGSVNYKIDQAFNEFATNISNDNVVNTYKELVDYAASHSAEFTELVGEFTQLQTDVDNLESDYSDYKKSVASQFSDVETAINEHIANTDNPHSVTAEQVGAYTKEEVDTLLEVVIDTDDEGVLFFTNALTDASGVLV